MSNAQAALDALKEGFSVYLTNHLPGIGGYDEAVSMDEAEMRQEEGVTEVSLDFDEVDRDLVDKMVAAAHAHPLMGQKIPVIFRYTAPHANGDSDFTDDVWAGDPNTGVLLHLSLRMGEYCDENYDARGTITLSVGDAATLRKSLKDDLGVMVADALEPIIDLERDILKTAGPMASDLQAVFRGAAMERMEQMGIWEAIRIRFTGEALEAAVPQANAPRKPGM